MKIKPRDYQAEAVQLLFRTLKHDKESRPVIVLPTGAGKSVLHRERDQEHESHQGDQTP